MMVLYVKEFWGGKTHKFKLNTCNGVQWNKVDDKIVVKDYYTWKTIKTINIAKYGSCYIDIREE